MNQLDVGLEVARIVLREHQSAEAMLHPEEVSLLRRRCAGQLDVLPGSTDGSYTLQAHQYIGFIVLPTGRLLEIRPKVSVGVLFAMLSKVHRFQDFQPESALYSSVADFFECVVQFFVLMTEDLVTRGILYGYEPHTEHLLAPRGKLLVAESVRADPVARLRHWCTFTEFTPDILENAVLKATCEILLNFPYRQFLDIPSRLRRLQRVFAPVTSDPNIRESLARLEYNRLNEHYRPALALAQLLLSYLSPSGSYGTHQFLAYLVDMNALFERYVTAVLSEQCRFHDSLRVQSQDKHPLDMAGQITVRPDVVFYRDERPCLALDAKYKRDEHNADIYQALAYSHALNISRVLLAYPLDEAKQAMSHRIRPGGQIEIVPIYLDLSGGIDELKRQSFSFAERVLQEVYSTCPYKPILTTR